jgi:hypothetical protein
MRIADCGMRNKNSINSINSSNTLNKVLPLCRATFLGAAVLPFFSCAVKNYLTATRLNCNTAAHDVVTATLQNRSTATQQHRVT